MDGIRRTPIDSSLAFAYSDTVIGSKVDAFFARADSWSREPRLLDALRNNPQTRRSMGELKLLLTQDTSTAAEKRDALSAWLLDNPTLTKDVFSLELGMQLSQILTRLVQKTGFANPEFARAFFAVDQAFGSR